MLEIAVSEWEICKKNSKFDKKKIKHLTMKHLKGVFAKAFEINMHTLTY